ncbi:hypothetical protein EPUL_004414, partial [Erysiphe pulchra]
MLFLAVVVAILPALITAKGQLGFALGNKKPDGSCKFKSDYIDDLKSLNAYSKIVRIYAASDCDVAKELLPAAQEQGAKVVLGIWPDTDDSFQKDKSAVLTYAPQYPDQVYAITVGSESLYRGNFTGEQLLSKILDVKNSLGGKFKVGTADSWNKFQDGTADPVIKGGADIILCNAFSYWQGQTIADSSSTLFDDVSQAFGHIQSVAGGADKAPELWVGEAGWPTAGQRYQNAQPGITEASTFWSQSICGIRMWGVNIFSFEAFDEPWKPKSVGTDGTAADETHWVYSSSTPPPALAEEGLLASSPAISSSSTVEEEEEALSPTLPPLPEPKFNGHIVRVPSPRTPLQDSGTEQTGYFTASWGSPYQTSPSLQLRYSQSRATSSEEDSIEAPFHLFQLQTPFLRPAPSLIRGHTDPDIINQDRLTSATVLANRARRKRLGLTEDWIRKHTCGDLAESNHWLSDGEKKEDPQTPTLKSYFDSLDLQELTKVHKRQLSASTLRQEDFYSDSESSKPKHKSFQNQSSVMDTTNKPLPIPSSEEWRAAALPSPVEILAPTTIASVELRTKKKIPWGGKYILILLPTEDDRGKGGCKPQPMTDKDVQDMLINWKNLGYHTQGFDLGPECSDDEESAQGQSRTIWPLTQDILDEKIRGQLKVSIPDKRDWDRYVQQLQEAKLRSLGVSLSEDEPVPQPFNLTSIPNLSRRASVQYPSLPFSPPIPTSSAGSSHINLNHNPFSPVMMPPGASMSTNHSSHPASIASPLLINDLNQGKNNLYHSNSFTTNDRPFGSPFQLAHQQSPISWTPGQTFHQQGLASGCRSPSKLNLGPISSPLISFSPESCFQQMNDSTQQLQQRQNMLQTHVPLSQSQQSINETSPHLEEVKEHEDERSRGAMKAQAMETLQEIRQENSSLQEEIEAAEYHLESQIQRELEHKDYSPHSEKGSEELILHHPQPHSRNHSLFKDKDENSVNFIDIHSQDNDCTKQVDAQCITITSNESSTPIKSMKRVYGQAKNEDEYAWNDNRSPRSYGSSKKVAYENVNHKPKASFSKLNVTAKEFTFNPSGISTIATATSSSGLCYQQSSSLPLQHIRSQGAEGARPFFTASGPPVSTNNSQVGHMSGNFHHGQLNYPPIFVPGNGEFNFPSMTPNFKSTSIEYKIPGSNSMITGINTHQIPIFGNIDLSKNSMEKPSKRSKAIPIVRPDETKIEETSKKTVGSTDKIDSVPTITNSIESIRELDGTQQIEKKIPSSNVLLNKEKTSDPTVDSNIKNSREKRKQKLPSWSFPKQQQSEISDTADSKVSKTNEPDRPTSQASTSATSRGIFHTIKENFKYLGHKRDSSSLSLTTKSSETKSNNPQSHNKTSCVSTVKMSSQSNSLTRTSKDLGANSASPKNKRQISRLTSISGPTSTQNSPSSEVKKKTHDTEQNGSIITGPYSINKASTPPHSDTHEFKGSNKSIHNDQDHTHQITCEEGDSYSHNNNQTDVSLPSRQEKEVHGVNHSNTARCIKVPDLDSSSPIRLLSNHILRSDAPSPSPKRFHTLPGETKIFTRDQENLFKSGPLRTLAQINNSEVISEWDDVISEAEESKIKFRAQFFDNHVNNIVGGILAERLGPLEQTLGTIQESVMTIADQILVPQGSRSAVGAFSDADDEDEDGPRPIVNLRRDKRLSQIKAIIQESIASINLSGTQLTSLENNLDKQDLAKALQDIKNKLNQPTKFDLSSAGFRDIIKETIERKMPGKILLADGVNVTRIADLQSKLSQAESRLDEEVQIRRAAEDRLSEIQRQLRISSEEEHRLRAEVDQRELKIHKILDDCDAKVRSSEVDHTKSLMQITVLEAAEDIAKKNEASLRVQIQKLEDDLRASQQQNQRWQMENERAQEASRHYSENLEQVTLTNKELRHTIERLKIQSEESIRVREVMRGKLIALQEDMACAAREITDENSRRAKKEQELIARQEVLDARLQAEARTRERMETEIERLERGERDALRAVNECKKLEDLVAKLTEESHIAKKDAMRYQLELTSANDQMNIMRENFERQIFNLRSDIDQGRLDFQNMRVKSEKLVEEIEKSKKDSENNFDINLAEKVEDLKTQHSRRLHNITEEAQRQEQHLLERLSLSNEKTQILQDRVAHLEEKLEIANAAAAAAVNAAKSARSESNASAQSKKSAPYDKPTAIRADLPEKISSQALRETIISLQEQLQDRESTIESLESTVSSIDPEIALKISKRDDEIMWLRELLAVRKSDLSEIVQSLEQDHWDVERVKDAAIRLRTNLQMQEQELERAINGGSALPSFAASLKDVASPRVAQAVGPLVAVLGSWRKSKTDESHGSYVNFGPGVTPSRNDLRFVGGILTPPNSTGQQQTKPAPKFKVLNPVNQRFTSEQLANRPRVAVRGMPPKKVGNIRRLGSLNSPEKNSETNSFDTMPIMMDSSYDQDATEKEFNETGFHQSEVNGKN